MLSKGVKNIEEWKKVSKSSEIIADLTHVERTIHLFLNESLFSNNILDKKTLFDKLVIKEPVEQFLIEIYDETPYWMQLVNHLGQCSKSIGNFGLIGPKYAVLS